MALLDDTFKGGNVVAGAAIGLGTLVLAPTLLPLLRGAAKLVIKTGMVAYEEGRAAMAGLGDQFSGIVQEARGELESDGARRAHAADDAASHAEASEPKPRARVKAAGSSRSEPTGTTARPMGV